jgi:hypothetical protein
MFGVSFLFICGILLSSMAVATNAITLECLRTKKDTPRYQFVVSNLVLAVVVLIVLLAGFILNVLKPSPSSLPLPLPPFHRYR